MSRRLIIGLLLAALSASCGFQVRGSAGVPPEMARTYIAAEDRQSLFYRAIRSEFLSAGIDVVDSPADATAIFAIEDDISGQRVLAVSARNVPREYEVNYTVGYSLADGQSVLMDRREQTKTQAYTWDETKVLGKTQEEQVLRTQLVNDIVRIVMIQLAAL